MEAGAGNGGSGSTPPREIDVHRNRSGGEKGIAGAEFAIVVGEWRPGRGPCSGVGALAFVQAGFGVSMVASGAS